MSVEPASAATRIVLFDLDGTITDSAPGIHEGFRRALAAVGMPEPTEEMLDRVVGPPMVDTFRSFGLDDATVDRAIAAYFEYYDTSGWMENAVFDGIRGLLAEIDRSSTRLAVATSKNEKIAARILEHFGLADHFEFIGGASEDGTRRAKSDVIAHSLAALGVETAEGATTGVLMVGDRDHDVDGAGRWGIPTVFVEWGYGAPEESTNAVWTAADTTELGRILADHV